MSVAPRNAGWTPPSRRASMLRRPGGIRPAASKLWKAVRPGAMATLPLTSISDLDRTLLERAAQGDEAAFEQLYDRYSAVLYALAFRIAAEASDAEEIVLDSFTQAWRDATRFRPERGSVIAWLTTICRSRALDLVRARGRRGKLLDSANAAEPDATPAMGSPPAASDRELDLLERRKWVADALRALSVPQRQAIELAYYEGLSHSEIAERLGEPLGTVKTRVRLAMEKLREMLRPYYVERSA